MAKESLSIHAAMTAIQAECRQIAASSLKLNEAYDKVVGTMSANNVLCMGRVIDHQHVTKTHPEGGIVSLTTVMTEWVFSAEDGSSVTSRGVGIAVGAEVNMRNAIFLCAYKQALLQSFAIKLPSFVSTAPALPPAGNVANAQTPAPTKRELAEASKALLDWQNQIDKLSIEEPGEWNEHRNKLKLLLHISRDEKETLFNQFRKKGAEYGVGYDESRRMFYLAAIPAID